MSKKEFIWLGIRVIGFYWLIRMFFVAILQLWGLAFWLLGLMGVDGEVNYAATWVNYLTSVPVPLFLCVYFLFFGKLIYKFIHRFVHTGEEEVLDRSAYCQIVIRFLGLFCIGKLISSVTSPFLIGMRSLLTYRLSYPEGFQEHGYFARFFEQYLNIGILCSIAIYAVVLGVISWYFLKRGKMFINLLGRIWIGN